MAHHRIHDLQAVTGSMDHPSVSCSQTLIGLTGGLAVLIAFAILYARKFARNASSTFTAGFAVVISVMGIGIIHGTIVRLRNLSSTNSAPGQQTHGRIRGGGGGGETNAIVIVPGLPSTPTAFTYEALAEATDGFRTAIGCGGFGSVYKGTLIDGTAVAVKCLPQDGDHESFQAEVAALAGLNHTNLVRLMGLCPDPSHKILVYEFMENSSLDCWIFSTPERRRQLDWKTRRSIALGAAKGLAYLHDESRSCVLHLDVKPENILLDGQFRAKIADFGLARTLKRDLESRLMASGMRGTRGYMAPEWLYGQGVTAKADVFSFGAVLLEMVCGRRCVENAGGEQSWYLPSVAFRKAREGSLQQMPDPAVELAETEEMEEIVVRLMKIGLLCLQGDPELRPAMSSVVSMIQGDVPAKEPPPHSNIPFAPSFAGNASMEIVVASSSGS